MKPVKIFVDRNYPNELVQALETIHDLQSEPRYQIVRWADHSVSSSDLKTSLFLLIDTKSRGLDITTVKHFEEGYRVVAYRIGTNPHLDLFEFGMTVLRVWPYIMEKATEIGRPFLYTFKYGGRRLREFESAE